MQYGNRIRAAGSLAGPLDCDRRYRRDRGRCCCWAGHAGAAVRRDGGWRWIVLAARQSLIHPRRNRETPDLGGRGRGRQEPEPEFRASAQQADRAGAGKALVDALKKIKGLEGARGRRRPGRWRGPTAPHLFRAALSSALSERAGRPGRRRLPDHRRPGCNDIPASASALGFQGAQLHALITGVKDERDRRHRDLGGRRAFGIVRTDPKPSPTGSTTRVCPQARRAKVVNPPRRRGVIKRGARSQAAQTSQRRTSTSSNAGPNIVEIEASPLENEAGHWSTTAAVVAIDGVRDKTAGASWCRASRIPGRGRTWRNLLKSDPKCRPRAFHDFCAPPERSRTARRSMKLSLIAFPTRELFQQKINEFQLIIFDRYARQGRAGRSPISTISRAYVRLRAARCWFRRAPDYASTTSIWAHAFGFGAARRSRVGVTEKPFYAHLSDARQTASGDARARWLGEANRRIGADSSAPSRPRNGRKPAGHEPAPTASRCCCCRAMARAGVAPLLLTDHIWLWARGYEGGGPPPRPCCASHVPLAD